MNEPYSFGLLLEGVGDLVEAGRVEVLERKVLQLPLHALHTEPVGDGGVYLHRLERLSDAACRSD